jgi:hypothetical protein
MEAATPRLLKLREGARLLTCCRNSCPCRTSVTPHFQTLPRTAFYCVDATQGVISGGRWTGDVLAFRETCEGWNVSAQSQYVERFLYPVTSTEPETAIALQVNRTFNTPIRAGLPCTKDVQAICARP